MSTTNIEWTDATWNPLVGCSEVSPGCLHCYAAVMAHRLAAMAEADLAAGRDPGRKRHYIGTTEKRGGKVVWSGGLNLVPAALADPLGWKKPRRVFVNSMSDLFHKTVPFEFVDQVLAVMAMLPRHTFQVLTKRPERMARYFESRTFNDVCVRMVQEFGSLKMNDPGPAWLSYFHTHYHVTEKGLYSEKMPQQWPLPNVWLGTSVENQEQADKRIPPLLRTPAAVRFLSIEPLLGQVDLTSIHQAACDERNALNGKFHTGALLRDEYDAQDGRPRLHWVIVGGESGHGARPMHPDWARSLRDQCVAAGVPFFFKQWGEWLPFEESAAPLWESQGDGSIHVCGAIDGHALPDLTEHEPVNGWYWPAEQFADPTIGVAIYRHVGKKTSGRLLDGRAWNEMPEVNRG